MLNSDHIDHFRNTHTELYDLCVKEKGHWETVVKPKRKREKVKDAVRSARSFTGSVGRHNQADAKVRDGAGEGLLNGDDKSMVSVSTDSDSD